MTEEDVIAKWRPLINRCANTAAISSSVIDTDDLVSVGEMAAVRALRTYNSAAGAKLSSYVYTLVKQAIYNEAARFLGVFTVSHYISGLASSVCRMHDSGLTDKEIASKLTSSRGRTISAALVKSMRIAFKNRNASPYIDRGIIDESPRVAVILQEVLHLKKDREIFLSRVIAGESVSSIAARMGISESLVRSTENYVSILVENKIKQEFAD